nr:unnamed protein product [Callosobruchus chinensis]
MVHRLLQHQQKVLLPLPLQHLLSHLQQFHRHCEFENQGQTCHKPSTLLHLQHLHTSVQPGIFTISFLISSSDNASSSSSSSPLASRGEE